MSQQGESTVSSRIIKIAILAIALGMVMMLIALGTGLGLKKEIAEKTVALTGHIQVAPFNNNESLITVDSFAIQEMNRSSWYDESLIQYAYSYASKGTLLKFDSEFEGAVLRGVDQDFPWEVLEDYLVAGKFPKFDNKRSRAIVLSQTLANRLGARIGDRILTIFQSENSLIPRQRYFTLAAIYQTGFPDFDQTLALVDLRQTQQLNRWSQDQIGGYVVYVNSNANPTNFAEQIYQRIPPHLDVRTVNQLYASIYDWIALFDFNILIILLIMLAVGTLNMATALLVLILERSRMVGVLKVLGASQGQIQQIFLWNAFYILLRGMLIGNAIGLGILFVQWKWAPVALDPATYFVSSVPIHLPFFLWFGLNLVVFVAALFLLWLPASIINRIEPARVLQIR